MCSSRMAFKKEDFLTKTRKLVKGLAKAEPTWHNAMEMAPPVAFPKFSGKVHKTQLPEDTYAKKFLQKHPGSMHEDAVKNCDSTSSPARVFGLRVLELRRLGVTEDKAIAVAEMEYHAEKTAKERAYSRLKQIACIQGKPPPPKPFADATSDQSQRQEGQFAGESFLDPKIRELVNKMKEQRKVDESRLGDIF